jgi:RNA polymerase sigma-70 factor, ECF subfamily
VKLSLFAILRDIWLNQLDGKRTTHESLESDADENTATPVVETSNDLLDFYVIKRERDQVRNAIRQLPIYLREVILLHEYEGLSLKEIASLLDCPVGTVSSRLARARCELQTMFSVPLQAAKARRRARNGTA